MIPIKVGVINFDGDFLFGFYRIVEPAISYLQQILQVSKSMRIGKNVFREEDGRIIWILFVRFVILEL